MLINLRLFTFPFFTCSLCGFDQMKPGNSGKWIRVEGAAAAEAEAHDT